MIVVLMPRDIVSEGRIPYVDDYAVSSPPLLSGIALYSYQ